MRWGGQAHAHHQIPREQGHGVCAPSCLLPDAPQLPRKVKVLPARGDRQAVVVKVVVVVAPAARVAVRAVAAAAAMRALRVALPVHAPLALEAAPRRVGLGPRHGGGRGRSAGGTVGHGAAGKWTVYHTPHLRGARQKKTTRHRGVNFYDLLPPTTPSRRWCVCARSARPSHGWHVRRVLLELLLCGEARLLLRRQLQLEVQVHHRRQEVQPFL